MKCRICNCNSGKYVVCYKHRTTKYKYNCKIHGKTDFIGRQCLKCLELKQPVYSIVGKKDRFGKRITKNHFLYPYLDRLTNYDINYQQQFQRRISNCSGVYGIFYKNICLYVGQSVNITNRIEQHKKAFKVAQNHLRGIRLHKKKIYLSKIQCKVEYKYYEMAKNYKLSDLTYKTLFVIPKLKDEFEYKELLTYAEQSMINTYKPKCNLISARPSDINRR
ncbi:MAG: hypothetical protein VZS44_08120 [Bacilli bacterium]|nr:hypothetical protein [Bacilli bacterium]